MTNGTVRFYNDNADDYAARERGPNPRLFPFLQRCKAAGKVLELGTGGGVDAAAIIKDGFDLDATDGSSELAAIATRRLGRPVRTMLFDELDAIDAYDGIYACASLTHVPRPNLQGIIEKVYRALTHGGAAWASFKTGVHEGTDALGRYYNYLSADELIAVWREAAPWRNVETESWLGGAYDSRATSWVAITAIR
ncbi:class I SAM-dependent methyltransferase [Sinorhizobium fredii]|uniref:class I SAM-dependent methyltransferase n=1 Tax=Rhizobium fredii TaxID=380 RepID=UPI000569C14A|nr:class I SAM-dependent methyltransferase [Sinorhizobium fredii]